MRREDVDSKLRSKEGFLKKTKHLTFSHSVFTCPSDSCLHSLSCSIHWSSSFVNAFSSISVFSGSRQFYTLANSGQETTLPQVPVSPEFTKRPQQTIIALLSKDACTASCQITVMIWLNWNRRGRERRQLTIHPRNPASLSSNRWSNVVFPVALRNKSSLLL